MHAPVIALSFAMALSVGTARDARIVGSDLLGPEFTAAIRAYAMRNDFELMLALDGSRDGLGRIEAGTADVGLLVLRPEEAPPQASYRSVPLGYFTTVVLVPAASPLSQITLDQLAGIFGTTAPAGYSRWGELGLRGEWATRPIAPQVTAISTGLSLELFRHRVLAGGGLRQVVARQDSIDALVRKLATDAGGIALAGSVPDGADQIKVLLVAKRAEDVAIGPTRENVHAGDYPLRLPLWLVVRREFVHRGGLDLLRFLLNDEIASLLQRVQIVPLPLQVRNQLMFDLEQS